MSAPIRTPLPRALACAALPVLLAGCSVVHLGRSGRVGEPTAVAPEKESGKRAKEKKEKKADAVALEPLDEARLRSQQQPGEPWWPYQAATLELKAGRAADAEASLRASIARDSAYAPALSALSRTLYEQGRHEEAIQLLAPVRDGRVTMNDDDRAAVLAGLALHEVALGREADARQTLSSVPRDEAAGVSGFLEVRGGDREVADKATRAALRGAPNSAAFHNNRGIALLRAADADAAEKEFLRAIELEPSRPAAYYNLAILERWYRLDPAAAAARFKQYWNLSHADPDSLYPELGRRTPTAVDEGANK
ncbi:MAG TPA: tetratricopeptide repeat protein [Methylomirabilota bacterium]|nr:tetratricopeptide repeat protein [Methylomirabilota bacterium]